MASCSNTTPPMDPNTPTITRSSWKLFTTLPTFDLMNGDISDVRSVSLKVSISTPYHWVPIDGLSPPDAEASVYAFIVSHMAHMAVNQPTGLTPEQTRKAAICLGTIRAVSTSFYRLDQFDIVPDEKADSYLKASKGDNNELKFAVKDGVSPEVAAVLNTALDLTDVEKAAICAVVKCATGIIAMQGYSLMMTNHHYLSQADTQSRKVFAVVERAYWRSQDVNTWFSSDTTVLQDVMWHKACHPVVMDVKTNSAMDPNIGIKLTQAGSGACASRLPAIEMELRSANSYVKLMSTVGPMFAMCGGAMNFDALVQMTKVVQAFPPGVQNPTIPESLPADLKGLVTNRAGALTQLSNMLKRNQDVVAYCYGFYVAMSEYNMMMGSGAGAKWDTLKSSFSLAKLKNQSFASYTEGYQAYGDYQAAMNAKRQRGEFTAPNFQNS